MTYPFSNFNSAGHILLACNYLSMLGFKLIHVWHKTSLYRLGYFIKVITVYSKFYVSLFSQKNCT